MDLIAAIALAAAAQQLIPVRALAPPDATTATPLRNVLGNVRQLPNGMVLVSDAIARLVVLLDSTLATSTVVRDSVPGLATSYGPRPAVLLPYVGDTTLFTDMAAQAFVVVDPIGAFTRIMAPPNQRDMPFLLRAGTGIDARGRLIYQGAPPGQTQSVTAGQTTRIMADSEPILRGDFDTRRIDTIARVRSLVPYQSMVVTETDGKVHMRRIIDPLQAVDGWATLSDGSIAIVRGHDYHIDWIDADGTQRSTPKMPFDWRRLTDDDKRRLIDSARTATRKQDSLLAAARANAGIAADRGGAARIPTVETEYVPPSEMVDYYPPMRLGAVRADLGGNIWILPTTTRQSMDGELVYDVVNRNGEVFERVRVPAGRSIAGFGRGGVVFLMWRDGSGGWIIERTRVVR